MHNHHIRAATRADIKVLTVLSRQVHLCAPYTDLIPTEWWDYYEQGYSDSVVNREKYAQKLMRYIARSNHWARVYEDKGNILGFHLAYRDESGMHLRGIFVGANARGQGIGKALFAETIALAKRGEVIELTVLSGNTNAIEMYKKFGFTKIREVRKLFFGAKQDSYVLVKE